MHFTSFCTTADKYASLRLLGTARAMCSRSAIGPKNENIGREMSRRWNGWAAVLALPSGRCACGCLRVFVCALPADASHPYDSCVNMYSFIK